MIIDKIENLFKKENRDIVFYFDEDNSFGDELEAIENSTIQLIRVDKNYFELKNRIEGELKGEKLFLYHNFSKPNKNEFRNYPLLDLLIANVELRLDPASEFIQDYKLGSDDATKELTEKYISFLKVKTNQKKISKILESDQFTESNLQLAIVSAALGFNTVVDKNACMSKWLSTVCDDKEFSIVSKRIIDNGMNQVLVDWFKKLFNCKGDKLVKDFAIEITSVLKYNVLMSNISSVDENDTYSKLKMARVADINRVTSFYNEWENNTKLAGNIDVVFSELGSEISISKIIEWYGPNESFGYYSDEMNENLLSSIYDEVQSNPVKAKSDTSLWLQKDGLSDTIRMQIVFLHHASEMYSVLESYNTFKFNSPEKYIEEYTSELYKVDLNFREAISVFGEVRGQLNSLEDKASKVFDTLNQKYDRFLIDLNKDWQERLNEKGFDFHSIDVKKQFYFYENFIEPLEQKTVVIISDALRYELGHSLYNELLSDSKSDVTIAPCLASMPSYTNLGKTNLLPHKGITVEIGQSDLEFKIEGIKTVSTQRAKVLQSFVPESTTFDYNTVNNFDQTRGRKEFKDNKLVYVYHNYIDDISDKQATEYITFEASKKAIKDLKGLISKLYNWNVYKVIVTSDHGFLYNHVKLNDSSREDLPKMKNQIGKGSSRYVIGELPSGKVDGYIMDLKNTTNLDTDLKIVIPKAINRFRKSGSGIQFVHGGASLQELITPVVIFNKKPKKVQKTVTFSRLDKADKITSGMIKILLFQDVSVSSSLASTKVSFALYSDSDELLSNEEIVVFDSISGNPKERQYSVLLKLNSVGAKSSFAYLKAFAESDTRKLKPLGSVDLFKISTLMARDEF